MEHGTLLSDIALGIIFAVGAAILARFIRQPLLLGYVGGGILLSHHMGLSLVKSEESIEIISEMGLIFLLFIIGLEINLRELARMGKSMLVLGISQFALSVGIGLLALQFLGSYIGSSKFGLLYLAVASSLSSTLIVVKLLQDKFEVKTLGGRLTIGILVFQDIWAILFMGLQPNLEKPDPLTVGKSVGAVVVLIALAFVISKYLLSRLFNWASRTPELILLTSIAWCFLVSGGAQMLGLSMEMGALIAGVSIAAFPYGNDVISKLGGVRDFFVTLFFVALGMKIPVPDAATIGISAFLLIYIFVNRILTIVPVSLALGNGLRAGFITALNLSQISEFSLVILALGVGYKHIDPGLASLVLTAMIITSVVSTYIIKFNDRIASFFVGLFSRTGLRDTEVAAGAGSGHGHSEAEIVVLGYFRIARAFLDQLRVRHPAWTKRTLIVDYNAALSKKLEDDGFSWAYGDLSHPETLGHSGIENARVVICTISDTFLKGITTRRLLQNLKQLAPAARIVMVGEEEADRTDLLALGAHHVVVAGEVAGKDLFASVESIVSKAKSRSKSKAKTVKRKTAARFA
ncbi:MAG: cation:proton antiporter [Leptospirales bacterium]|nr:cation:proton antiporter [Leptospirales bacterium]